MITNERLNLTAIKYFIKVAENKNITQTANELFITQPVLSRHIKELEKETELQLFIRLKYGVELTEEGKRFYRYCKELESSVDAFCNNLASLNGTHLYNLKIGYQKSGEQLMIATNCMYIQKFPQTTIDVVRQEDVNFKKLLRNHQLNIAFNSSSEYTTADQDISFAHIMSMPQMLMVSRANPIAQMERVHFSQLRDQKWILPTEESLPHKLNAILQYCRLFNFEPNVIGYERQYTNYIIDVLTYNAVAILTYVEEVAMSNPQIAFVPLDGFPCDQSIGLMWLKKDTNPAIDHYVASARRIAEQKIR